VIILENSNENQPIAEGGQKRGQKKPLFWADAIAQQADAGKKQVVGDAKTPSGKIHVGALRGVVIHDLIYKALVDAGRQAEYIYRFDDLDPMDSFPTGLPEEFRKYMGMPLCNIPSPEKGFDNFAKYYALEFQQIFESLGCKPRIVWASEAYKSGSMNEFVRTALEKSELVREINERVSGTQKGEGWLPINAICEKCGKIGTTKVSDFDGKTVAYTCGKVKYAEGCGHSGRVSPFDGKAKLTWKAEWAAQFKRYGITIEGAGKDHLTVGGSRMVAEEICEKVFNYPQPYRFAYEFFLIGGKKMSSSKGVGVSAKEVSEILTPELLRFLMTRYKPRTAIDFNPEGETIPRLFDDFDNFARTFFGQRESRDPDEPRIYQLSQVNEQLRLVPVDYYKPDFGMITNLIQIPHADAQKEFEKRKGMPLDGIELLELKKRTVIARKWLEKFADDEHKITILQHAQAVKKFSELTPELQKALNDFADFFATNNSEELQWQRIRSVCETHTLPVQEFFKAAYQVLIGKEKGPKLLPFVNSLDKQFVVQRLKGVQ